MKNVNKINILFVIAFSILLSSCCDCELEPVLTIRCFPREATATVFDPSGTTQILKGSDGKDSLVFTPGAQFSIHQYKFPTSRASSGETPNDTRFVNASLTTLKEFPFTRSTDNKKFVAKFVKNFPFNEDLVGDILVEAVDTVANTATIRINGDILLIRSNYLEDNSSKFCNDIVEPLNQNQSQLKQFREQRVAFGNAAKANLTLSDLSFFDENGGAINDPSMISTFQNSEKILKEFEEYLNSVNGIRTYGNMQVRLGEAYYYRSRSNGREYIFLISSVRSGSLPPYKRRMTILFTSIE
jgi:hypothetical protein